MLNFFCHFPCFKNVIFIILYKNDVIVFIIICKNIFFLSKHLNNKEKQCEKRYRFKYISGNLYFIFDAFFSSAQFTPIYDFYIKNISGNLYCIF